METKQDGNKTETKPKRFVEISTMDKTDIRKEAKTYRPYDVLSKTERTILVCLLAGGKATMDLREGKAMKSAYARCLVHADGSVSSVRDYNGFRYACKDGAALYGVVERKTEESVFEYTIPANSNRRVFIQRMFELEAAL